MSRGTQAAPKKQFQGVLGETTGGLQVLPQDPSAVHDTGTTWWALVDPLYHCSLTGAADEVIELRRGGGGLETCLLPRNVEANVAACPQRPGRRPGRLLSASCRSRRCSRATPSVSSRNSTVLSFPRWWPRCWFLLPCLGWYLTAHNIRVYLQGGSKSSLTLSSGFKRKETLVPYLTPSLAPFFFFQDLIFK